MNNFFEINNVTFAASKKNKVNNVSLKIENTGASQSWRLGTFRLDIQPDGRR